MAPLALIAKEAGFEVTGSDIEKEFITDSALKKAGITPLVGFHSEHITNPDFVITTGAHNGFDNTEVLAAKAKNIPVITQGEAVGLFMKGEGNITIAAVRYPTTYLANLVWRITTTVLKKYDLLFLFKCTFNSNS